MRPLGLHFFMPALLLSMLTHLFLFSSLSLSYFILAVPMRKCLGKHSCMSSSFPIVILNDTCFFPIVQLQVHIVYSEQKTRNSCALVWHTATCYLTAPHCIRATSAPNIIYQLPFPYNNHLSFTTLANFIYSFS